MKWKTKHAKACENKFMRITKRFAFFPIKCQHLYIWLEIVYLLERWEWNVHKKRLSWNRWEFVTKDEYIKWKEQK